MKMKYHQMVQGKAVDLFSKLEALNYLIRNIETNEIPLNARAGIPLFTKQMTLDAREIVELLDELDQDKFNTEVDA